MSGMGRWLRFFLRCIPAGTVVPIMQGKLRGKKWIKGSGVNGYWLGSYELKQQQVFGDVLKDGNIVFDVGAHVGFYSLLAAEVVGPSGKVFAFEPNQRNFDYLEWHIKHNGYRNTFPFQVAVSNHNGRAYFDEAADSAQGHLTHNPEGAIGVQSISLDTFIEQKKLPAPTVLKIDVEGAELRVLQGAANTLKNHKPIIFLSTHREDNDRSSRYLELLGYRLEKITAIPKCKQEEILAMPT